MYNKNMNYFGFASAPSNIALMKYWGKNHYGMPMNPSLSMTLGDLRSFTKVSISDRKTHELYINNTEFKIDQKLDNFLSKILNYFKCNNKLKIESVNNFPISVGIASSASGYAALTTAIFNFFAKVDTLTEENLKMMQVFACNGSKSSVRSIVNDSQKFVKFENNKITTVPVHEIFSGFWDFVICIDKKVKEISSSDGHSMACKSIFNAIRVEYANNNIQLLCESLKCGDFEKVQSLVENDTLLMHAAVAENFGGAMYLTQGSKVIISELIKNRGKHRVIWTCDAGANVHLLFHEEEFNFIDSFLAYIKDFVAFDLFTNKSFKGISFDRT